VLNYEVPSETHLQAPYLRAAFEPQLFVDISAYIDRKLAAVRCFESQIGVAPALRSPETLKALATWRGAQIGCAAGEAFVVTGQVA
jgi:LmbE family N-acetylglucosaminyl deacetylase